MEKLYYIDQYIKEFTAEVLEIREVDGKYHIKLDRTAFFPGGGGQDGDTGCIGGAEVIEVYEENNIVYHVSKKKPNKIHRVKCEIDWNKRFDGMQQHLGQHLLSGVFFELFNRNTTSIHLGHDISTVDIEGQFTEEEILKAEEYANKIIFDGVKVQSIVPTKSELKKMKLRRALPKTNEEIRVLIIEDLDINACCGVHPGNTRDLQVIKIKKAEKHKDGTRIEYYAGNRAVEDYFRKDNFATTICRYLSCNELEGINSIKNLKCDLKNALDDNRKIQLEIADYKVKEMIENSEKIGELSVIKFVYENENIKQITKIANKLVEKDSVVALLAIKNQDKANLLFASSKNNINLDMNTLLKDSISLIDGRGGGSKVLAQGAGKNNSNLDSALDYAIMRIKKS